MNFMFILCIACCNFWIAFPERIAKKPMYLIAAPTTIRPEQEVTVHVTLFDLQYLSISVRARISNDKQQVAQTQHTFQHPTTANMQMKIPSYAGPGNYSLVVEGSLDQGGVGHVIFHNATALTFDAKHVSVFIQTDKIVYNKKETVHYRIFAVHPNQLPVMSGSVLIQVKDAAGHVTERLKARQIMNGVYESSTTIWDPAKHGWWTLEVHGWGQIYTHQYLSVDYFTTRMNINVTVPSYITESDYALGGIMQANYTCGKLIHGNATVTLEIRPPGWPKDAVYPTLVHQVAMMDGIVSFIFPLDDIRQEVPSDLAGTRLIVEAKVMDWYSLDEKTSTAESVIYSRNTVLRFLGGNVRVFKPGEAIPLSLSVSMSDGRPLASLQHRQVLIQTMEFSDTGALVATSERSHIVTDDGIISTVIKCKSKNTQRLKVTAKSSHSSQVLTATRHQTMSNNYLTVSTSTYEPQINTYMVYTVRTTAYVPQIVYMVISQGEIVLSDILFMSSSQRTFSLALSRLMVPRATMLVYCILNSGEVLTDTLSFRVNGIASEKVAVNINKGKDFSLDRIEVSVKAEAGTYMALSAANYDLYKLGTHSFLTKHKVEEEMSTYDSNTSPLFHHTWLQDEHEYNDVFLPTPSYAVDAFTTFKNAGLAVFSDAYLYSIEVDAYECNTSRGLLPCFNGDCYPVDEQCDGLVQCTDGADEMGCPDVRQKLEHEDELSMLAFKDASVREQAIWAWKHFYTKPSGRLDTMVSVPLRPSTWLIQAVTMSRENGLSFTPQPARVDTTRPFHIFLEAPSTARRGEQIGLQVTVINHWEQAIEAILTVEASDDYASVYVDNEYGVVSSYNPPLLYGDVQTMVSVRPGEQKFIHFPILPHMLGKVKVTVRGTSMISSTTASRTITVTMEGLTNTYHTSFLVDLVNKGSIIIPDLWINVPERFVVPNQRERLYIPGSATAEITISGDIMGPWNKFVDAYNILDHIYGDGEKYLFNFGYNLYNLKYLKLSNQLSEEVKQTTVFRLRKELIRFFAFFHSNEAIGIRRRTGFTSTWLTAYALDVLSDAKRMESEWENELYIEQTLLDNFAAWLVTQQLPSGAFQDNTPLLAVRMKNSGNETLSVTAVTAIGLFKALNGLTGSVQSAADSAVRKALDYLAEHLEQEQDPFTVCAMAYAFTVANHPAKSHAVGKMKDLMREDEYIYWSPVPIERHRTEIVNSVPIQHPQAVPKAYTAAAIQASAYGLMVYLQNNWYQDATLIMKWLQTQRYTNQGFDFTWDTVVTMQALNEFAERDNNRDLYAMRIQLEATSSPGWSKEINLERGGVAQLHSFQIPNAWGAVRARAQGTGMALMQLTTKVNVEHPWQLRVPTERSYDLDIDNMAFKGRNGSIYSMTFCARWSRPDLSPTSGTTTIAVDIPTGYMVKKPEQKRIERVYSIPRARFLLQKFVIYMDMVNTTGKCWTFEAQRLFPIANGTIHHKVTIWNDFELGLHNYTVFTTYNLFHNHICQVCGSYQCPYCPFFNSANTLSFSMLSPWIIICAGTHLLWLSVRTT